MARIKIFASGFVSFVVELILRRPDVVHLHTSERGSFVRKGILIWVSAAWLGETRHAIAGPFDGLLLAAGLTAVLAASAARRASFR